ncbi:hypothetical protein, partial [Actinoplanes sp. URMC 104]|uniref:hypothetical protein n=1 Tax=Actinoplanes sp. URMC 104 TaxID=3423409 RepID=UPI003F1B3857
ELRKLSFTLGQIDCIADVLNGTALTPTLGQIVWMELADAFEIARDSPVPDHSSYGFKWSIDEQALLERVSRINPIADLALRDAVARWWKDNDTTAGPVEVWKKYGITVIDTEQMRNRE